MPTVDQHLRAVARSRPDTPSWVLEKDYALLAVLPLDAVEIATGKGRENAR